MMTFLQRLWSDESGQDLVEYAFMAGFVAAAAAAIMPGVAKSIGTIIAGLPGEWETAIRIVCAVLAVALLILIVWRRQRQADK